MCLLLIYVVIMSMLLVKSIANLPLAEQSCINTTSYNLCRAIDYKKKSTSNDVCASKGRAVS